MDTPELSPQKRKKILTVEDYMKEFGERDPFVKKLHELLLAEKEADDEDLADEDSIAYLFYKINPYASNMVRYNNEDLPMDVSTDTIIINPATARPYSFEDIGVNREECRGPSTGTMGRDHMIPETAIALLKALDRAYQERVPEKQDRHFTRSLHEELILETHKRD